MRSFRGAKTGFARYAFLKSAQGCAMDQSYHYKLIARAIALIDAPGGTTRRLDDLAAELGLSPAHFQRVFSGWAGVSPKRYQQYLTIGHARHLLRQERLPLTPRWSWGCRDKPDCMTCFCGGKP